MHIELSAPQSSITTALADAVRAKFERLTQHTNKTLRAHVVLHTHADRHRVEAQVRGAGKPLVASAEHEDMYAAINEVAHILDRQWRKRKTRRLQSQHSRSATIRHT